VVFGIVHDVANLRESFAPYYSPNADIVAAALRTGIVAPDTNVMLAAYRFERQARDELFSAFEKLGDRLWVPHQAALEFHRNRLGVISAQEDFFGKTRNELEIAMSSYVAKLRAFTNRISMPQSRTQELEQMIQTAHAAVTAQVTRAEEANEVHLDRRDSDEVLTRLEALLDGRVGDPMQPQALSEARKEAIRRVENKIPPGYADKDKVDPCGDYLVWAQLMREATTRNVPVVLVTDDRKEDWVRKEHGLVLGPRPELYEEMSAATGKPFLLMSTATFLRHAREYLSVSVSPETVDQARELPDALDRRRAVAAELVMVHRELEKLRERNLYVEMEAAEAAHKVESLEARLREARRDPSLSPVTMAEAEADYARARTFQREAERQRAMLVDMERRAEASLEALLAREHETQEIRSSLDEQGHRE
jgi:hypothetical protein